MSYFSWQGLPAKVFAVGIHTELWWAGLESGRCRRNRKPRLHREAANDRLIPQPSSDQHPHPGAAATGAPLQYLVSTTGSWSTWPCRSIAATSSRITSSVACRKPGRRPPTGRSAPDEPPRRTDGFECSGRFLQAQFRPARAAPGSRACSDRRSGPRNHRGS